MCVLGGGVAEMRALNLQPTLNQGGKWGVCVCVWGGGGLAEMRALNLQPTPNQGGKWGVCVCVWGGGG